MAGETGPADTAVLVRLELEEGVTGRPVGPGALPGKDKEKDIKRAHVLFV